MTESNNNKTIEADFLEELPVFENFLHRVGFKRIDGAVYGLLVLSNRSLTSEEIEQYLGLSQSAISISLKNLTHYGAVESREHPENKRIKLHTAKEDSLKIAATIFRKREQQYVEEFKAMAKRLLKRSEEIDQHNTEAAGFSKRSLRLRSIILTCEIAESVMKFVIGITQLDNKDHYQMALQKLPKALDLLAKGTLPLADWANQLSGTLTEQMKSTLTNKIKDQMAKLNETRRQYADKN